MSNLGIRLAEPDAEIVILAQLDWPSVMLRLHTGLGVLKWNGYDWTGMGELASVGKLKSASGSPNKLDLTLAALDDGIKAEVLAGGWQGRRGQVFVGNIGADGKLEFVERVFSGDMDTAPIVQGQTNAITLTLVDRLADWNKKGSRRHTNESHLAEYPLDHCHKYALMMEDFSLYWGSQKQEIPLYERR